MFKYGTKSEYILAFATSSRRIVAALVHDSTTGPVVLRTFTRKREGYDSMMMGSPEVDQDIPSDVSFRSTNEGANASMFLASEFGGVPVDDGMEMELMPPTQAAIPCDLEIQDILAECTDAGYDSVRVVFALPSDFVESEIIAPPSESERGSNEKKQKGGKRKPRKVGKVASRESLLKQLKEAHPLVEDHQAGFLPLFDFEGNEEAKLALFAQSNEPVTPSIATIRNRKYPFPNISLLDNEISLLLGAARATLLTEHRLDIVAQVVSEDNSAKADVAELIPAEEETTVVIRVGSQDTLVMFMIGPELVHFESLRSITAFDPTDTICSRILLMFDEFGAGDSDRILLFCDESEISIREKLDLVFPDSHISLLRHILPPFEETSGTDLQTDVLLAVLVGLRLVRDELWESVFPETDFLDPKLRGRKITLPFSWPVAAMILILFSSTLFFVQRYFVQRHEIEMVRYELRVYPENALTENADELQDKIDNLRMRSTGFVEALDILDSLLVGSDVWSRAMERTSSYTRDVDGLWIQSWEEQSDGQLVMNGTALDRSSVVEFATRADANIDQMTFSDIRGVPVFEFELTMGMNRSLPEAASYLREHVAEFMRTQRNESEESAAVDEAQTRPPTDLQAEYSSEHIEAGG